MKGPLPPTPARRPGGWPMCCLVEVRRLERRSGDCKSPVFPGKLYPRVRWCCEVHRLYWSQDRAPIDAYAPHSTIDANPSRLGISWQHCDLAPLSSCGLTGSCLRFATYSVVKDQSHPLTSMISTLLQSYPLMDDSACQPSFSRFL